MAVMMHLAKDVVLIVMVSGYFMSSTGYEILECVSEIEVNEVELVCAENSQIKVVEAVYEHAAPYSTDGCDNPELDTTSDHCTISSLTDHFRVTCNTRRTCTQSVTYPNYFDPQCTIQDEGLRATFFRVKYQCVTALDPNGDPLTVFQPLEGVTLRYTGPMLVLQSLHYPNYVDSFVNFWCTIPLAESNGFVLVDVHDVSEDGNVYFSDNCVLLNNGLSRACMQRESTTETFATIVLYRRAWIVIEATAMQANQYYAHSVMDVDCVGVGPSVPISSVTTTVVPATSLSQQAVAYGGAAGGALLLIIIIIIVVVVLSRKSKKNREVEEARARAAADAKNQRQPQDYETVRSAYTSPLNFVEEVTVE